MKSTQNPASTHKGSILEKHESLRGEKELYQEVLQLHVILLSTGTFLVLRLENRSMKWENRFR